MIGSFAMCVKIGSSSKILVKNNQFVERSSKAICINSPFLVETSVVDLRVFDEVLVYDSVKDVFKFIKARELRVEIGTEAEEGYSFGTSKGDIFFDNDLKYWRKIVSAETKMIVIVKDPDLKQVSLTAEEVAMLFNEGKQVRLLGLQGVSSEDFSDTNITSVRVTSVEKTMSVFDSVQLPSTGLYLPNSYWNCASL